jgi:hypothetical protein
MSTTNVYRVYDAEDQLLYTKCAEERLGRRLSRIAAATGYRWEKEEFRTDAAAQLAAELAEIVGTAPATAQVAIETLPEVPETPPERSSLFIRIPADLHWNLRFRALDLGRSMSALVEEAIREAVLRGTEWELRA